MDGQRFDALTRMLATPLPRRQALRRVAGLLAGAAVLRLRPAPAAAESCPPSFPVQCGVRSDGSPACCQAGTRCCPQGNSFICCPLDSHCCNNTHCCYNHQICIDIGCTDCPTGQIACGDTCVDTQTDPANCGACANACAPGETCDGGSCGCGGGSCAGTCCGGTCTDTQTDSQNCGGCGNACAGGKSCVGGTCSCPIGQTDCGGTCVDTQTDPDNCGACGIACSDGYSSAPATAQVCSGGQCGCPPGRTACSVDTLVYCADLNNDYEDCGACGNPCTNNQICVEGNCGCPAGLSDCAQGCTDTRTDPCNCGACGEVCDGQTGGFCANGACSCPAGRVLCGAPGDYPLEQCDAAISFLVCCPANQCRNGVCQMDKCTKKGQESCVDARAGEKCCDPTHCEHCLGGVCVGCPAGQRCLFRGTPEARCAPR